MNTTFKIPDGYKNWNCEMSGPEGWISIHYVDGVLTVSSSRRLGDGADGEIRGGGGVSTSSVVSCFGAGGGGLRAHSVL